MRDLINHPTRCLIKAAGVIAERVSDDAMIVAVGVCIVIGLLV